MLESTMPDEEAPTEPIQGEESSQGEEQVQGEEHAVDESANSGEDPEAEKASGKKCCEWLEFQGCTKAKGYAYLGMARGAAVMSNIFLASSLIYLASEEAGCLDEEGKVIEDCENKVYGFQPPSLIANIAVISGLLSAFLMPLIGAIVDFTPYRRLTGILAAVFLTMIQAAQIATVLATWFIMLILQAIAGFIYQVEVLATYAYLPEIAREVGEKVMTQFTSIFVMMQFTAQALFLIVVIAIGYGAGLDDVQTAHVSQAINVVWISIGFHLGWRLLQNVPARHELQGKRLWTEGFKQVWRTTKSINKHYPHGLRWFLLATVFAEAGANAFTVVSVIFLDDHLQMSAIEIGVVFLITLFSSILGAKVGSMVTNRTNPNKSWKINLVVFSVVTFTGSFALATPDRSYLAYVWGVMWGVILGWFYSTENLFFSMVLPKGQEAELTGFFVYCTQILVWLPPLVFTVMIENGVGQQWGLMSLIIFFVIAFGFLSFVAPWDQVLEESAKTVEVELVKVEDDEDEKENVADMP